MLPRQVRFEANAPPELTLPILMYHAFTRIEARGLRALGVPQARFREQVQALLDHGYRVLSLREAVAARSIDSRALVALTVDDGYVDSLIAAEVLQDLGASGTMYLPTATIGRRSATWLGRRAASMPRPVTWDEVHTLSAAGMEIGSHAHSHIPLDVLKPEIAFNEMHKSREILEFETGSPVSSLCYPHGYNDQITRRLAAAAGYENACAIGHRVSDLSSDDPYSLPRLMVQPHFSGKDVVRLVERSETDLTATLKAAFGSPWRLARRTVWNVCRYSLA